MMKPEIILNSEDDNFKWHFKIIPNNGAPCNCLFASILQASHVYNQHLKLFPTHPYNMPTLRELIVEHAVAEPTWSLLKAEIFGQHSSQVPEFKNMKMVPINEDFILPEIFHVCERLRTSHRFC